MLSATRTKRIGIHVFLSKYKENQNIYLINIEKLCQGYNFN